MLTPSIAVRPVFKSEYVASLPNIKSVPSLLTNAEVPLLHAAWMKYKNVPLEYSAFLLRRHHIAPAMVCHRTWTIGIPSNLVIFLGLIGFGCFLPPPAAWVFTGSPSSPRRDKPAKKADPSSDKIIACRPSWPTEILVTLDDMWDCPFATLLAKPLPTANSLHWPGRHQEDFKPMLAALPGRGHPFLATSLQRKTTLTIKYVRYNGWIGYL